MQGIRDKRSDAGVWHLEQPLRVRKWVGVEVKGQPGKWATLFALMVSYHLGRVRLSWPRIGAPGLVERLEI